MADKKKSKKKLIVFGTLGALLVIVIILVLSQGGKEEIIPVQTEKSAIRNLTQTVIATGKIQAEFKVLITPEVTGEIVDLPVKEGDRVTKGQLLLRIKSDIYASQLQRAQASLESVRATLMMRQAEFTKVSSDYTRMKELHAKNLASDADLEAVKSLYLQSEASIASARASVTQSEAQVREAQEQLNKTIILSPIEGTITELNVEKGERVLGSGFSQGTNCMTVSDLNNMEALVDVDENDIVKISLGDTAKIKVDAFGEKKFNAIVTQMGNSAKAQGLGTQEQVVNFQVRIKFIELDKDLRPGMSCNASIETETRENVVSVPIQSVTARTPGIKPENGDQPQLGAGGAKVQEVVFVVENNKAVQVNVTTGISDDNYIEIKTGLEKDQEVVTGSYQAISRELKNGSLLRVENTGGKPGEFKNP